MPDLKDPYEYKANETIVCRSVVKKRQLFAQEFKYLYKKLVIVKGKKFITKMFLLSTQHQWRLVGVFTGWAQNIFCLKFLSRIINFLIATSLYVEIAQKHFFLNHCTNIKQLLLVA